jgi:hypothetical protein
MAIYVIFSSERFLLRIHTHTLIQVSLLHLSKDGVFIYVDPSTADSSLKNYWLSRDSNLGLPVQMHAL